MNEKIGSSLINIDMAQQELLKAVNAITATEAVLLLQAYDRVLAQDYFAAMDVPPAANSAMDGYALNSSDFVQNKKFSVSQRIAAGDVAQPLTPGTLARIFTGAEIPFGADAVIIQENCIVDGNEVY